MENSSRDVRIPAKEMDSKKKTVNEINIQAIQEVATDIGAPVKYTSNIRGKTVKLLKQTEKYKSDIEGTWVG